MDKGNNSACCGRSLCCHMTYMKLQRHTVW